MRWTFGFGSSLSSLFFFFNDTATPDIYTLSLHDALPISHRRCPAAGPVPRRRRGRQHLAVGDRKSTRLNSSHTVMSYAVFCLKKKTKASTPASSPTSTFASHNITLNSSHH